MATPSELLDDVIRHVERFLASQPEAMGKAGDSWQALAGSGALERALRQSVEGDLAAPELSRVQSQLAQLRELIADDLRPHFTAFTADCWRSTGTIDPGRILRGLEAWVTSALIARAVGDAHRLEVDSARLNRLVTDTERLLESDVSPVRPRLDVSLLEENAGSLSAAVLSALPAATRRWVQFWLPNTPIRFGALRARSIGTMAEEVTVQGVALHNHRRPVPCWVTFTPFDEPRQRPLEAPHLALRPVEEETIAAMNSAWRFARARPVPAHHGLVQGASWRISYASASLEEDRTVPLVGDSISLAAHVAAVILVEGRQADSGVMVVGRVDENGKVLHTGLEAIKFDEPKQPAVVASATSEALNGMFAKKGLPLLPVATVDEALVHIEGAASALRRYLDRSILEVTGRATRFGRVTTTEAARGVSTQQSVTTLADVDVPRNVRTPEQLADRPESRGRSSAWLPRTTQDGTEEPGALDEFTTGERGVGVLLGPSGMGKSQIMAMTFLHLAAKARSSLALRTPVADIMLPVWCECEALGSKVSGASTPEDALDRVLDFVRAKVAELQADHQSGAANLIASLRRRMPDSRSKGNGGRSPVLVLICDGFDQMNEPGAIRGFERAIQCLSLLPVRILVSSREHAFRNRTWTNVLSTEYELVEFTSEQQRTFLDRWYGKGSPDAQRLARMLQESEPLRNLAGTPLLLTLLCRVVSQHPDLHAGVSKARLYELALTDLAAFDRASQRSAPPEGIALVRSLGAGVVRRMGDFLKDNFVERPSLLSALEDTGAASYRAGPAQSQEQIAINVLQAAQERGLLVALDAQEMRLGAPHRSFAEYLAAVGLARDLAADGASMSTVGKRSRVVLADLAWSADDAAILGWRDTIKFAVGIIAGSKFYSRESDVAGQIVRGLSGRHDKPESVILMGEAVVDAGLQSFSKDVCALLQLRLLQIMRDDNIPPRTRAEAGDALANIGDPRFVGWATKPLKPEENPWFLPMFQPDLMPLDPDDPQIVGPGVDGINVGLRREDLFGFIEIPAGSFIMGSTLPPERRAKLVEEHKKQMGRGDDQ